MSADRRSPDALPPAINLKGRRAELATLTAALTSGRVRRLALVGGGGSGKSVLAATLAQRLRPRFPGGVAWLRVGNWDHRTLLQMLAMRLGVRREPLIPTLRKHLLAAGPMLVVLDNHENDREMARFFEALADTPVTWIVTARRCLLSGVSVFPVIAPLIQSRRNAFPAVRALTSLLRWNPLALGIANALVGSRAVTVDGLRAWLDEQGVSRVRVMAHEDDVAEVRLLVDWAWARLTAAARRTLTVLAHCPGDHMDGPALATLARAGGGARAALNQLRRWELVQEPLPARFALHAVVRYAIAQKASLPADRYFDYYVRLLEHHPERFVIEQSHLFAAMDHAQAISSLDKMLRVEALVGSA
ncbi:MAG: AAA family ATPase [Polyangia bacterium]